MVKTYHCPLVSPFKQLKEELISLGKLLGWGFNTGTSYRLLHTGVAPRQSEVVGVWAQVFWPAKPSTKSPNAKTAERIKPFIFSSVRKKTKRWWIFGANAYGFLSLPERQN